MADDTASTIWRIAYSGPSPPPGGQEVSPEAASLNERSFSSACLQARLVLCFYLAVNHTVGR